MFTDEVVSRLQIAQALQQGNRAPSIKAALELLVPDHLLESEPGLELVPCTACDGQGWIEYHGSAYSGSCGLWGRPDLNFTLKPCCRCHCEGEVLDFVPTVLEPDVTFLPYRLAA